MASKALFPALAALALIAAPAAVAQSASELLEKGIYTEETVGDLDQAIEIYRKVVAEAKAAEAYAAEAQYRLGQCLLKQKKHDEAVKAFETLIKEFPGQEDWVAKAKKHVPGAAELKLDPVPWQDGEFLQLGIKLGGGLPIGTFIVSADATEFEKKDVWRMKWHRYILAGGDNKGVSTVYADRKTFRPIRSVFHHTLLGNVDADYTPTEVTVTTFRDGESTVRKVPLTGVVYDNEQGIHLFRRLPLTEDYTATLPIFAAFGAGKIDLGAKVTATETVEVPAGKFECHRLHLDTVNQDFWISTDPHRYVVKFDGAGVIAELTTIGQNKPGQAKTFRDEKRGFSVSVPPGWYWYQQKADDTEDKVAVHLLDPQAVATTILSVRNLEDLADDERASVKAWAEANVAESAKAFKDFKVRSDSWQSRKVSGRPAMGVLADYVDGERKKVGCFVYILGESNAGKFVALLDVDKLDDFRKSFDQVVDTFETK